MPILWQTQGQILNSGHQVWMELYFNKKTSGLSLEGGRRAAPRYKKKLLKKKKYCPSSLGIGPGLDPFPLSCIASFLSQHINLGQLIQFCVSLAHVNKRASMLKWDDFCRPFQL